MDNQEEAEYLFKFIIIGDTDVGKSCLMLQFINHGFTPVHNTTIGVDFGSRIMDIDTKLTKIYMWDTAGQEAFRSIVMSYFRGAAGALLVYDTTRRSTFENLEQWVRSARENSAEGLTITLVGNKCDMVNKREVSTTEGERFASVHGLDFFETSARSAQNVEAAFVATARRIYERIDNGELDISPQGRAINLTESAPRSSNCC